MFSSASRLASHAFARPPTTSFVVARERRSHTNRSRAPAGAAIVSPGSSQRVENDVVTYIAQGSHEAAVRLLVAALDTASSLDQYAERGRIVPELNQPDLRELFVFGYRLLYRVRPG